VRAAQRALISATLLIVLQASCRSAPAAEMTPAMSNGQMATLMAMDDAVSVGKVMLDQLELEGDAGRTNLAWDGQAWYGTDYNKIWFKSEGAPNPSDKAESRNELLWDRIIARWWNLQAGVRYDLGQGPSRGWAAAGLQGLAPYRFDIEATLYVADRGRTAARFRLERDVLITQRLILQPEFETDLYGKADVARQIGAGLSDFQLGLRLRYEVRREIAPYVGVVWRRDLGTTAQFARASGTGPEALQWVAGLHLWF
jgi:copper resistance protein B